MEKLASSENKPKKRRKWLIVTVIIVSLLLLFSFVGIGVGIYMLSTGGKAGVFGGDAVAVIRLDGVIASSSGGGGLFGGEATSDPESFAANMKQALDDESVKAILIRVNSPGGSPAASQEMYDEVQKAAMKKPVIASVADVAASGSYYAISPATEIMAVRASDIGSIGVFAQVPDLQALYAKLGIKMQIVKEGKFKTMGDPSKPLTAEERKILQSIIKEIYNQFIDDVAKAREPLTLDEVKKLATGRTWVATEAKTLGLIDSLGNYQDAISKAAKLGKIKGEPQIITYDDSDWLGALGQVSKSLSNIGKLPQAQKM